MIAVFESRTSGVRLGERRVLQRRARQRGRRDARDGRRLERLPAGRPDRAIELVHVGPPLVAILLERAQANGFHVRRDLQVGTPLARRNDRLQQVLGQDAHEAVGVERNHAGQHVVHDAAHRVDVHAVIGRLPLRLLGRHVLGRSEDHPGLRQPRAVVVVGADDLRDPEVQHLHEVRAPLALNQEDVLRLHVAVDDPLPVRGAQPLGDLHEDAARAAPRQRALGPQGAPQVLPLQELHRDVDQAVAGLPEVRDVDDVLVADARGALRLLQEARDQLGTAAQIGEEDLQRDALADDRMLGLVHRAHAPLAHLADDPVAIGDDRPDQRIFRGRRVRVTDRHRANLTRDRV